MCIRDRGYTRVKGRYRTAGKSIQGFPVACVTAHEPNKQRTPRMKIPLGGRDNEVVGYALAIKRDLMHKQSARRFDQRAPSSGGFLYRARRTASADFLDAPCPFAQFFKARQPARRKCPCRSPCAALPPCQCASFSGLPLPFRCSAKTVIQLRPQCQRTLRIQRRQSA